MSNEKMITVLVPESLIVGLPELSGPVLLYMDRLRVEDGFALSDDEFVTSVKVFTEISTMAGVTSEHLATLLERA